MIIDLAKFIAAEQPFWSELDLLLKKFEDDRTARCRWISRGGFIISTNAPLPISPS